MRDMITSRPITGNLEAPEKGKIYLPVETALKHVGADLYEINELSLVSFRPPTVSAKKVRFRVNPYIARSDLRAAK